MVDAYATQGINVLGAAITVIAVLFSKQPRVESVKLKTVKLLPSVKLVFVPLDKSEKVLKVNSLVKAKTAKTYFEVMETQLTTACILPGAHWPADCTMSRNIV